MNGKFDPDGRMELYLDPPGACRGFSFAGFYRGVWVAHKTLQVCSALT